MIVSTQVQKN